MGQGEAQRRQRRRKCCAARAGDDGRGCWSPAQALGPDLLEHAGSTRREAVYFPGPKSFRLRPCSRRQAARITPIGLRSERVGKPKVIQ